MSERIIKPLSAWQSQFYTRIDFSCNIIKYECEVLKEVGGRAPHSVFDQCMGVGSMNPIDAPQTAEVTLFR